MEKAISMEPTFSVLNTSYAVVKLRPKKKNQVCTGLQPFNYAITLNTLPTELKNQLGAEHYVGFK